MKIKSIQSTAQFMAIMDDKQPLMLEVKFLSSDELSNYTDDVKMTSKIRGMIMDAVVGWDLADENGTPHECTKENKAKYLPIVLGMKLPGQVLPLVYDVLKFAGDSRNYLKN